MHLSDMTFAIDSEREAAKTKKHNIIEHHLVSHYKGTICVQNSSLKWFLLCYILFDLPSPLSNAEVVISTEAFGQCVPRAI